MNGPELSFGEYLRQLIKDSGMTQIQFYTRWGIRKPYFYDILSGRANPPPYPLQIKAMEILNASEETQDLFFDLAARGRDELPADVVQYVNAHPNVIASIRKDIKRATCQ